jgi:RNA-binding protein
MSEMTPGKRRFIKRKFGEEKPTVWIGKSGASPELIKEICKQLSQNKYAKCKILKSALTEKETKQITTTIAEQTRATLVEVRGHTFILYKPRDK